MLYLLSIPLGIALGYIVYRIELKNQLAGYIVGILPYSILFWLSFDNRDFWDPYRGTVVFATIIAVIIVILLRKTIENKA